MMLMETDKKSGNGVMSEKDKNLARSRKALFRKSVETDKEQIRGYDFEQDFDAGRFFGSFKNTGFHATNLGKAIELTKKMREEKAQIFLGFTSNMASCGVRDIIAYLVKNRLIQFIVTTTGGVE